MDSLSGGSPETVTFHSPHYGEMLISERAQKLNMSNWQSKSFVKLKCTSRSLSLSYQKKDWGAEARKDFFWYDARHCAGPPIGRFPHISRGFFLPPMRSAQISGVNGPICMGIEGLELTKTKQNKLKMASFSPESFPIEQSLDANYKWWFMKAAD